MTRIPFLEERYPNFRKIFKHDVVEMLIQCDGYRKASFLQAESKENWCKLQKRIVEIFQSNPKEEKFYIRRLFFEIELLIQILEEKWKEMQTIELIKELSSLRFLQYSTLHEFKQSYPRQIQYLSIDLNLRCLSCKLLKNEENNSFMLDGWLDLVKLILWGAKKYPHFRGYCSRLGKSILSWISKMNINEEVQIKAAIYEVTIYHLLRNVREAKRVVSKLSEKSITNDELTLQLYKAKSNILLENSDPGSDGEEKGIELLMKYQRKCLAINQYEKYVKSTLRLGKVYLFRYFQLPDSESKQLSKKKAASFFQEVLQYVERNKSLRRKYLDECMTWNQKINEYQAILMDIKRLTKKYCSDEQLIQLISLLRKLFDLEAFNAVLTYSNSFLKDSSLTFDNSQFGEIYQIMGMTYMRLKKIDRAIKFFQFSKNSIEKAAGPTALPLTNLVEALTLQLAGQLNDDGLNPVDLQKQFNQAHEISQTALQIAESEGREDIEIRILSSQSELMRLENFNQNTDHLIKTMASKDAPNKVLIRIIESKVLTLPWKDHVHSTNGKRNTRRYPLRATSADTSDTCVNTAHATSPDTSNTRAHTTDTRAHTTDTRPNTTSSIRKHATRAHTSADTYPNTTSTGNQPCTTNHAHPPPRKRRRLSSQNSNSEVIIL